MQYWTKQELAWISRWPCAEDRREDFVHGILRTVGGAAPAGGSPYGLYVGYGAAVVGAATGEVFGGFLAGLWRSLVKQEGRKLSGSADLCNVLLATLISQSYELRTRGACCWLLYSCRLRMLLLVYLCEKKLCDGILLDQDKKHAHRALRVVDDAIDLGH